jgi:ActR/RegA family two-component response regulator
MDGRAIAQAPAPRLSIVRAPADPGASNETKPPRFLIASDDEDLRETLNEALTRLSGHAVFVRSGNEALASAHSGFVTLALLDQCLRDVDALDVARSLSTSSPELPFVLIGRGLTSAITVEAMKLGALTVLEKPVHLNQLIATIRSAVVETGTVPAPPVKTTSGTPLVPRSSAERWASHVLRACEADGDLRTLGAWASFVGLSYSSLCESCRLLDIQPLVARDFTRVLRAVCRARLTGCFIEELLDVSDRRTLRILLTRAGLTSSDARRMISIEQFFASQRFVASKNAGLGVLRALLLIDGQAAK